MIRIKNLTKEYGKLKAVNRLSLEIKKGEIFALLGLNGAGKSTTIKILCGLTEKTQGEVYINGLNLEKESQKIKSIVNLAPQETAVAHNLTVEENLLFIANLYGVKDAKKAVKESIEKFSLAQKTNAKAKTLSGGQKRRLSLAMAMITSPEVLILDEPTLGLDIKSRKELWGFIEDIKGEKTVILTTHYLEEAQKLANTIAIMNKGEAVIVGTAQEIIEKSGEADFESAFLHFAGGKEDE